MKVDNYEVGSRDIEQVIDKLTEADGSPMYTSRIEYLAEAAKLLASAIAEEVRNQTQDKE
jgi:hypothetical protein